MALQLIPPIHRATHRIGLYLADRREHGLSQGEAHILAQLAASSPATIAELHAGLAHKRSTLTSILDRLAERELITREPGIEDRRTFVIDTTARGRKVAEQIYHHMAALEDAVGGRVTKADILACLKVLAAVEDLAREGARPGRAGR
jgi:DNA-binding MarR family transcriptional regulator